MGIVTRIAGLPRTGLAAALAFAAFLALAVSIASVSRDTTSSTGLFDVPARFTVTPVMTLVSEFVDDVSAIACAGLVLP